MQPFDTTIKEITSFDTNTLEAINQLLPQLSNSTPLITPDYLNDLIHNPWVHIYTLCDRQQNMIGMITLCVSCSPTGIKAWIEDFVIDKGARGKGFGRLLICHAKNEAAKLHAKALLLTSRPERTAANALYTSLGLERRNTNVYRWKYILDADN